MAASRYPAAASALRKGSAQERLCPNAGTNASRVCAFWGTVRRTVSGGRLNLSIGLCGT